MANRELVEILKQGSEVWNEWRAQHQQIQDNPIAIQLVGANLRKADLSNVNLSNVNLNDADLCEANLSYSNLCDASLFRANLGRANLSMINLSGANLNGANLDSTELILANLSSAILINANLNKANLNFAKLGKADLRGAKLKYTNMSGTDLREANLSFVYLLDTDLSDALIEETIFFQIDLHKAKGLSQMHHWGPSHIALHTVQLPQDGSALHFLRGAGVPDEWIDDYRARMMHPIQYHSCFISYSSKDETLAHRLHSDLQDSGIRCWFAPHNMHIGDKIRSRIDEAIHLQDKLLLILSEEAVNSDWVEHEVETALARERRDRRTILLPIRLDNAILEREHTGWAALVQNERHIGDFTGWKDHDRYQAAFERLIRDLKKADEDRA